MSSNNASIHIDFHNQAKQFFFLLKKDFLTASENLNQGEQEFRFQQLKKDYVNELKQQLEMTAQELTKRKGLTPEAGQEMNDFIKKYLHRFVQMLTDVVTRCSFPGRILLIKIVHQCTLYSPHLRKAAKD